MTGKISYIIPVYNSKDTIKDMLDSIIKTDNVSEIILVDDCSYDGTPDVVDAYLKNHRNIKYARNKSRQGAGLSRNIGARMARGDILVFLDADIVIPPESGEIVKRYLLENRISPQPDAIVANRAKECLYRDAISMYKNYWTSFNFSKLKGWTTFLCASFFAIKKSAFMDTRGFRKIKQVEDNDLGYRLCANNYRIYFADDLIVSHKKKFSLPALLKREFTAGREGIKAKIRNKTFNDVIKEKKFFAVNKNFIYSFPFTLLFSVSAAAGIIFPNRIFLSISALSALSVIFLNREFFAYSSCGRNYAKGIFYLFLIIAQMNSIALGMARGLLELLGARFSKTVSFALNYSKSFVRLFAKRFLPPEQVTFFVTHRCNLNCSHCFVNKENVADAKELTVGEIDTISRKMGKINYVTITGGEPFLRKDIVDIVKVLNRNLKPSLITILTNGYMGDIVADRVNEILEDCGGRDILVKTSIDGPAEIHDKMRLKPGSFNEACRTFMKLKGLKRIYRNLSLGIITTYTNRNKNCIERLYSEVISDLAPDQYGLILERPNRANELNEKIDINDYIEVFKRVNMKSLSLTKGLFRKFRLAYKMRMADKLKKLYSTKRYPMKCFAGVLNAVISPEGDVFACEQLNSKLGSLREDYNWKKIWHSSEARAVRRLIKKKGCFCTNECYMPFNLSYDIKEFLGVLNIFVGDFLLYRSEA